MGIDHELAVFYGVYKGIKVPTFLAEDLNLQLSDSAHKKKPTKKPQT